MGAAGSMLTAALLELLPDPDAFVEELNRLGIPDVQYRKLVSVRCGIRGTGVLVTVNGVEEKTEDCDEDEDNVDGRQEMGGFDDENSDRMNISEDPRDRYREQNEEGDARGRFHRHGDRFHSKFHHHRYEDEGRRPMDDGYDRDRRRGDHPRFRHQYSESANERENPRFTRPYREHRHTSLNDIHQIVAKLPVSDKVRSDILAVYQLLAEAESVAHHVPVEEIHFHEVGNMDAIADITAVCLLMERLAPENVVVSPVHVGCGKVRCSHGILPVPAPATAYILREVPIFGGKIRGELCTPTGAALLKHFATRFGAMPVMNVQKVGYGMGRKKLPISNCLRAFYGVEDDNTNMISELSCNLDDMTPEAVGFAMDRLFDAGALDVYTTPITMKKSRPGVLLTVHCKVSDKDKMLHVLFKHTTTLGVRENISQRYTLQRAMAVVESPLGNVQCKVSTGYGVTRSKYEYEDLIRIARDHHMSLSEVISLIDKSK